MLASPVKPPIKRCEMCKHSLKINGELHCRLFIRKNDFIKTEECRQEKGVCGLEAHYFKLKR